MILRNLFFPHRDTHQKAYLISSQALFFYLSFFILLQVSFSILGYARPGILGISGNIDQKKIIELTNLEREKVGLAPVSENEALKKAAELKAQNMFSENYWAHFAPSGKTPWDFILGSGYKFSYAGENLAKNFQTSDEIVKAWMASPTHRDNLLNTNYQDIGIAVLEGVLNGQKTVLVVEEFGTTQNIAAKPTVDIQGKQITLSEQDYKNKPQLLMPSVSFNNSTNRVLINPFALSKYAGFSLILLIASLLIVDIVVLRKRKVFRPSSHYMAHMSLLSLAAGSLFLANPGTIL
ncbi:hypothetical protein HYT74_04145 [Candidatus Daviesbacteria bacterium]|nr:hypothetical protein [Candidatus Daviesbacteria bacterium]